MVKNHLKTIAVPKTWPVHRKENVFILRPNPGPHNMMHSISINYLLTKMLQITKTKKESVYVLKNKEIMVDGIRRTDKSFPVGLFDAISIKDSKKYYRIVFGKNGRLSTIETDEKDASVKPRKIVNKKLHNNKIQLTTYDGWTILVDKGEYKTGDSIIIDSAKKTIIDHLKLGKGSVIFLTGGKHLGGVGVVEDVTGNKIIYKRDNEELHESLKKYAFVIGKNKPIINIKVKK